MSDDDQGGELIDLMPILSRRATPIDDAPVAEKRPNYKVAECQHLHLEIDEALTVLTCKDCGEKISPLWWIDKLATRWRHLDNLYGIWQGKMKALADQVDKLKLERTRLQGQIRRLKAKWSTASLGNANEV